MSAEVKRIVSGDINFSPMLREKSLPLFQYDHPNIVDAEIIAKIDHSSTVIAGSQTSVCSEGIHMYLNEHDITEDFRLQLIQSAQLLPEKLLKSQYKLGVQRYSAFFDAMKERIDERKDDAAFFDDYLKNNGPDTFLQDLGDRKIGWGGNLHIFKYLYTFIPIQPVSMQDCWDTYRTRSGSDLPEKISELPRLMLTMSHHTAPSMDDIDATLSWPAGSLTYQVELSYKNPLEPRLREIARRIKQFNQLLEAQRLNYLEPIKDESEEIIQEVRKTGSSLSTDLEKIAKAIAEIG